MGTTEAFVHPYVPNAAPETQRAMLDVIGVESIEDLFESIPRALRLNRPLNVPSALASESQLERHMQRVLSKNQPTTGVLSFLGSGCYPHHVPAVCDEINQRAEFLTAYAGETYEDHGKWQALFEYTSLMAELLEMDVVNVPTYDGYQAAATALRMAGRITGRGRVVVARTISGAKQRKVESFLEGALEVAYVEARPESGYLHADDIRPLLDDDTAAVFLETPNVNGVLEVEAESIASLAHANGSLLICSTDPLSLGFTEAPASWGADIVCGDIQSLGLGLHYGGANGGFIATHDDERFIFEFPSRLFGLAPTRKDGEIGFCDVAYERTSLAMREEGVEWVGTAAALWGITAGAYLALMGPTGMTELGDNIAANTRYAMNRLSAVPGLEVLNYSSPHWREFSISYDHRTSADINGELLKRGIYGGASALEVVASFGTGPKLPNIAIYCVTELHSREDIDQLASALEDILK